MYSQSTLLILFILIICVRASQGDNLPEFQSCLSQCERSLGCDTLNVFEEIELQRLQQDKGKKLVEVQEDKSSNDPPVEDFLFRDPEKLKQDEDSEEPLKKRSNDDVSGEVGIQIEPELTRVHDNNDENINDNNVNDNNNDNNNDLFSSDDFKNNYELSPVIQMIFHWDCNLNCNYKCQQLITNKREVENLPMVKFYGKWPFTRILGITEFFSTFFSVGNFYINWHNLHKILKQLNKNKKSHNESLTNMYKQYFSLLVISCFGWFFSTLFHIRDNSITETLDYFGAASIIMMNFNVIVIRFFELFKDENQTKRRWFQISLIILWSLHIIKLLNKWDYNYNIIFNSIIGISSLILWIIHAINVNKVYNKNDHIYNNSIQLLPFETKILTKLNLIGIFSKTKFIPILPIFLNIWLLMGMTFEIFEFRPWSRLIDGHAVWHLFTIFPTIVWFDWNIWDLELYNISNGLNKIN